jgi:hypothetical protein
MGKANPTFENARVALWSRGRLYFNIFRIILVVVVFVVILVVIAGRLFNKKARKRPRERLVDAGDQEFTAFLRAKRITRTADRYIELRQAEESPVIRLFDMDVADLRVGDRDLLNAEEPAAQMKGMVIDME